MPKQILIVEDDADIAAIERDYLELGGYGVTIAPDGTTGLDAPQHITADSATCTIAKSGVEITLKNKEYELLLFLMRHPEQVFSREDLYEMIWGLESMGDNMTVAVHMNRLREKIGDTPSDPKLLQTVWGVGYRLHIV